MSVLDKLFGAKTNTTTVTETVSSTVENLNPLEKMTPKEKRDLSENLGSFILYTLYFILLVAPLLFTPFLNDWFDFPKSTLILMVGLIGLVLYAIRSLLLKKVAITRSVFDLPILLFLAVVTISALLSANKYYSLSADPVLLIGSGLIFFLMVSLVVKEKILATLVKTLLIAAAITSIIPVIQSIVHFLPANLQSNLTNPLLGYILSFSFSPAGSALSQVIFLIMLLPLALAFARQNKKLGQILTVIIGAGVLATAFILFQNRPILLDPTTGWRIATGSLGQSLSVAFFGVGPGNFIDAFTANKSLDFNNSTLWNLRFSTSSDFLLYVLTTFGIAGLATLAFLIWRIVTVIRTRYETNAVSDLEKGLFGSLILALIFFVVFPAPSIMIFTFFVLLAFLVIQYQIKGVTLYGNFQPDYAPRQSFLPVGLLIVGLGLLAVSIYYLGQFALADYYFAQSVQAAQTNRATDTYNFQIKANQFNPWNSGYHIAYSQTNLALANALAGQANLSDQQKQTVVALVQQAIREARVAAALAPQRSAAWENLSLIYRNLINFAQGADQWAVASENQAIALDPTNPRIRLDLGGIYFSLKDYQSAAQIFNQAANLKPDFANAHYNLAQALIQLNLKSQALQQLQLAQTLVCTANNTSDDCKRVTNEVQNLTNELSQGQSKTATPSAEVKPTPAPQAPLATPAANTTLPKAATNPPAKIASPGGELQP